MGTRPAPDEFDDAYAEKETPPPEKRGRGCLFYGCLGLASLFVLALVAVGLVAYYGGRYLIDTYTAPSPVELPTVQLPAEERAELERRVERFEGAARRPGDEPVTLSLTPHELNALLDNDPNLRGRLFLDVESDRLVGRISVPLDEVGLAPLKGRYLNGRAVFDVSARDGRLVVEAESITVNGRPLPGPLMAEIGDRNFAENVDQDGTSALYLEEVRIEDGKILFRARSRTGTEPPGD